MLNTLLLIAIIYAISYLALRPSFAGWSERTEQYVERFESFEGKWPKIFLGGWVIATVTATLLWFTTENAHVGLIVGTLTGLLGIAAWTDAHVHRVPLELTRWTIYVSLAFFLSYLLTNSTELLPQLETSFYPTFSWDEGWTFMLGCLGVILIGFLLAVKTKGKIALLLSLMMMFGGFYMLVYAVLASIKTSLFFAGADPYWTTMISVLLAVFVFLGVAIGYDLFLPRSGMGGADIAVFYTLAYGFSWWVTPYYLFIALLVAFALQLLLHMVAKPLGIGGSRVIKNGAMRQSFVNASAKRKGIEASTTHTVHPVPFIPMLVAGSIGTIIVFIGQYYEKVPS